MDIKASLIRALKSPNDPSLNGYTQTIKYVNQLPMGTPTPDPSQYNAPYWATPYGDKQIIHESDIRKSPLGYSFAPNGYSTQPSEESVTRDIVDRITQSGLNGPGWANDVANLVSAVNETQPNMSVRDKIMYLLRYTGHMTAENQKYYWDQKM